ncbi:MAG: ComF family protein [Almyronema sp.]
MLNLLAAGRSPLTAALNLFLQGHCPLCDRPSSQEFCLTCTANLQQQQMASVPVNWQSPLPVIAWGHYEGALKQAIAALKYQQQPQIGLALGRWLGTLWQQQQGLQQIPLTVVPIPLHPDKLKQRGYNQAELIAQGFCRVTRLPLAADGLQRIRLTEAQFGLGAEARWHNLAQAFALGSYWQKRRSATRVLLVDDIYTTGATAISAANTLRRQRISVLGIGAIAQAGSQVKTKPQHLKNGHKPRRKSG